MIETKHPLLDSRDSVWSICDLNQSISSIWFASVFQSFRKKRANQNVKKE